MWETFLLRAELEALVTGVAAEQATEDDLADLERAEQRFSRLARALRAREPGDDRRSLSTQWMQANHGFHDVIYRMAAMPYVEQVAKSARRTFSGPAVWAPGDETIDELYLRTSGSTARSRPRSLRAARTGPGRSPASTCLSSFHLLETILNQVARPKGWVDSDDPSREQSGHTSLAGSVGP